MKKKKYIIISSVVLIIFFAWYFLPSVILFTVPFLESKGESSGVWLKNSLISCGPRSIKPVIRCLKSASPFARNYGYLPYVLAEFGDKAKKELEIEIGKEKNHMARANLIYALQVAFDNFKYFHIWLDDAFNDRVSTLTLDFAKYRFSEKFKDVPEMLIGDKVNKEFIEWWNSRRKSTPT